MVNKQVLLHLLTAKARDHRGQSMRRPNSLEKALYDLNNQSQMANPLPKPLPEQEHKLITMLRKHFGGNMTFMSCVLNFAYPEKYLFYRVAPFEHEVIAGLRFFADVEPCFDFGFSRVGSGEGSFERYLRLNRGLLDYAHARWPDVQNPQPLLMHFLYELLFPLFGERRDYRRYWVMATVEDYWHNLDSGGDLEWSGGKEMQAGDLAFVYRTLPVAAMTDIYRLKIPPKIEPWSGWHAVGIELEKVAAIHPIKYSEMSAHQVLSQYGVVKRRFVGAVADPIPPIFYNRLLELTGLPQKELGKLGLTREVLIEDGPPHLLRPTVPTPHLSGLYADEEAFDQEHVRPLLVGMKLEFEYQPAIPIWLGTDYRDPYGKVDFLVRDDVGPLTLVEDKKAIIKVDQLEKAVKQARSYALLFGLPTFVVAAPEGMWVYRLVGNREVLVEDLGADSLADWRVTLKRLLVDARQRQQAMLSAQ